MKVNCSDIPVIAILLEICSSFMSSCKRAEINMALELVGCAFMSSFVDVILDRLTSSEVFDFFKRKKLNTELLEKIRILLLSVSTVINDADNKQVMDPNVKAWYEELKEVISDAEQVLDEINTDVLKREIEGESESNLSKRLKLAKSLWVKWGSMDEVESKMNNIIGRLQFIVERKDVIGLEAGLQNRPLQRVPSPLVDASVVYGRDGERENIIECLLTDVSRDEKISVFSIVGMGGIGKTTIAQLVFNDNRVRTHFDIAAWITVSDEFDIIKIIKTAIEILTSQKCCIEDLYQLQSRLKQLLMLKKFLFVLDDVWNENYNLWDVLKSSLQSGAHGSKIIITTRSQTVATMMGSGRTYNLQGLAEEDCWRLFTKHVFNNVDEHSDMVDIGREIVKKCKGHPLALKSLAGVLRSMRNPKEWIKILKNDVWELELQLNENSRNNILPALWLSYYYLPTNVKRCFAYCSIFSKDYEIQEKKLILLWMAEGLLQPKRGKTMEDVGKEYFQDLISRSLFQRSGQDESTIRMHDLVHDLAAFVAGESCVMLECDNTHEIPEKVRHVSYIVRRYNPILKFNLMHRVKYLRSFLLLKISSSGYCISKRPLCNLLPNLPCLRILSLSHYSNFSDLPDSIGNLKYLRYLDLSDSSIRVLPASISALYNLQTLILSNCSSLTQLPCDIGRLINLRHLFIDGTNIKEMPPGLSRLKNLQTLKKFPLGKGKGSTINELKHLENLRGRLCISGLEHVVSHEDALEANLKDKKHIEELMLKWNSGRNANYSNPLEILEKLQPHRSLRKLTVVNYGGKVFPNWLGDPSFANMVSLSLANCVNCIDLPPLGQLPFLKELSVTGFSQLQQLCSCFYGVGPFRSLEILKIEDMEELEEWFVSVGENDDRPFLCLRELHIGNCPKLTGDLPHYLPSLTELVIVECKKLKASLPEAPALCQLEVIRCDMINLDNIPGQLHLLTIIGNVAMEYLLEEIDNENTSLEVLNISECSSLRSLLAGGFPRTLKTIEITDCKKLELSMDHTYDFLESLTLCYSCDSLISFSLDSFPRLNRLHIEECSNLVSLEHSGFVPAMMFLSFIQISCCSKFESFPKGGLPAPNLKWLWVEKCDNLKNLPEQMNLLSSLRHLFISDCPKLESFPEGGFPSSLHTLSIFSCEKFIVNDQLKLNLESLSSLQNFSVGHVFDDSESFALKGFLPSSLASLHIIRFHNLKTLDVEGLRGLTSLKELKISNCEKLESIPIEGLPSSLELVEISDCPLLKQYRRYWDKIARNVFVKLDNEAVLCE